MVSVWGARALWLDESYAAAPRTSFLIGREFAHIHPLPDGSMHLALPPEAASEVLAKRWGEQHPVAKTGLLPLGIVMVYAPRDERELDVVMHIVRESFRFASDDGELRA